MDKEKEDRAAGEVKSHKIVDTFAPINSTDRPSTTRNFSDSKNWKSKRKRFGARKIGLSIGFVVMITLVGTLLFKTLSKGESSTTNQVKSVLSGDEMKEYHSPENNFTIKMPGFPAITKKNIKAADKEVPQYVYERRVENNSQLYLFEVNDYTGLGIDEKKILEEKLNLRIQNLPGAKLTSSKVGSYNGHSALEAQYSYTEKDKKYDGRVRFLVKDSKVYAATLIGGDQTKFEEFANSLRFG